MLYTTLASKIRQFAFRNAHVISRLNTASKMASLVAILVVIPVAISKPQKYQTAIKFDQTSPNVLVADNKTISIISAPSRIAVSDGTRGLNPEAIKALMREIAPEYGVNWKLVYAIGYYESGNYNSSLARRNYNFFGRKASSRTWMKYDDPESAIRDQFTYLKEHYFDRGLNTPAKIGPIYCEGNTWASKITVVMNTL
jgi:hypothetical protein